MSTPPRTQDEQLLQERLASLRDTPLPDGFDARLHQRLAASGPPESATPFARLLERLSTPRLAWASSAAIMAAVFLVVLAVTEYPRHFARAAVAIVPASKVALVKLDLQANVAVASADIRIVLPDGLFFWSDGQALAQRSFEWTQPLTAGNNEIPIAVRGERPGLYHVKVHAQLKGQAIDHDVALEITRG